MTCVHQTQRRGIIRRISEELRDGSVACRAQSCCRIHVYVSKDKREPLLHRRCDVCVPKRRHECTPYWRTARAHKAAEVGRRVEVKRRSSFAQTERVGFGGGDKVEKAVLGIRWSRVETTTAFQPSATLDSEGIPSPQSSVGRIISRGPQ
jgi:hypothetical protein